MVIVILINNSNNILLPVHVYIYTCNFKYVISNCIILYMQYKAFHNKFTCKINFKNGLHSTERCHSKSDWAFNIIKCTIIYADVYSIIVNFVFYYCEYIAGRIVCLAYFFHLIVRDHVVLNVFLPTEVFRIRYNTNGFDSRMLNLQQTIVYYVLSLRQCITRGVFLGFCDFVYRRFLYGRIQNVPGNRPVNCNNIRVLETILMSGWLDKKIFIIIIICVK